MAEIHSTVTVVQWVKMVRLGAIEESDSGLKHSITHPSNQENSSSNSGLWGQEASVFNLKTEVVSD